MQTFLLRKQTVFNVLLCLTLGCLTVARAQNEAPKFGKVDMKDLAMKVYDKDTSASAVILSDYGYSYFTYVANEFQVNFERVMRIKILKKAGYEWADAQIPLYKDGTTEEKVTDLKGYTYNLENGKVLKTKLEKEAVFEEKLNDDIKLRKFTMPNVKEGSVLEYAYTVKSEFLFNFHDWEFQHDIPVVWSEYRARIPEFFIYKQYMQGYEPLHISTTEESTETFSVRYEAQNYQTSGFNPVSRTPGGFENVSAKTTYYRWVAKDVPALKEEPLITTLRDYVTKIEFELTATKFGLHEKSYRRTWEEIAKSLSESEYFGRQLNRMGFVKDEIAAIKAKFAKPEERILATYAFVKGSVKWDGKKRMYPESTLKKAYEAHSGNSSDINMLLVGMLREMGLDANPVILSTRDHGRAPYFPLLSKYNYVIAHVSIGDKYMLMDATEPYAPFDMLPHRCLNGEGRLIDPNRPVSVPLRNQEKFQFYYNAQLALQPDGSLKGTIEESNGGYNGIVMRQAVESEGKEKYIESLKKKYTGWDMEEYIFSNLEKTSEILKSVCKVTINEHVQTAGNMIYLKPLLNRGKESNPFQLENRKFPVDFGAPTEETFILTLALPSGYQVEEMPKPAIISLPDNGGRFSYSVTASGNTLQVISKISIKKPLFVAEEYATLKEFYNHIVSKQAEQVVLKKI